VRDPHGTDAKYTGPWNDNDTRWTAAFKAQVPYVQNINDGIFFMDERDVVK